MKEKKEGYKSSESACDSVMKRKGGTKGEKEGKRGKKNEDKGGLTE